MFSRNLLKTDTSLLLTQIRTRIFSAEYVPPIVNKLELESVSPDDPRHYQKILPPNGSESPSLLHNPRLLKFTNMILTQGKYTTAKEIVDNAFYEIKLRQIEKWHATEPTKREEIETNPLNIFNAAVDNCKPILKLVPVQKGAITYQVPVPIKDKESEFRAMKFIIDSCFEKPKEMRYYMRLANELLDAYRIEGSSVKKKVELHKRAEANRAYAHYRWI